MKLTKEMANLICDLEYVLGSHCAQDNSYADDTIQYRYPVCLFEEDSSGEVDFGRCVKIKMNARYKYRGITGDMVQELHYKIGKNNLEVGRAIIDMLTLLEHRYHIDFNQLEEENNRPSLKTM